MNNKSTASLLNLAFALSVITVLYNIAEGLVSTFFGFNDETIALFGFGIDSFVEVISGAGVGHMIWRMKRSPVEARDKFERNALRITGIAFYVLASGLIISSILKIVFQNKPVDTIPGIIISAISILTMWILYKYKISTGRKLNSQPIISDANCTKTCFYLSFILLASSVIYKLTGTGYIDIIGAIGIAFFAFREGREAFEKIRSGSLSCSCEND